MQITNERPVCHRAEDLVTYLYGEANPADAQDFATHMQQCDACRAEFAVFNQVHDSIVLWRNEALGATPSLTTVVPTEGAFDSRRLIQHERRLSAVAALREFFSVSPLWLRGATAFAALLLCVLGALAISRLMSKPSETAKGGGEQRLYTAQELDKAVQAGIDEQMAKLNNNQRAPAKTVQVEKKESKKSGNQTQLASNRIPARPPAVKGLTRRERWQLAADLRLIPGRDEGEFPFVLTAEPER